MSLSTVAPELMPKLELLFGSGYGNRTHLKQAYEACENTLPPTRNLMPEHLLALLWQIKRIFLDDAIMTAEIRILHFALGSALSFYSLWSLWQDLNLRPFAPKANALPNCATQRLVEGTGIEPILSNYKLPSLPLT